MEFRNNISGKRYELETDGQIAFIDYTKASSSKRIYLIHTEVPQDLRNQGIADKLVKEALEDIKQQQWSLIPLCPFVVAYLKRHPAYHSIIDPQKRHEFEK